MQLYSFSSLQKAVVLKRPSAVIKSPYVADIQLESGATVLCHTPGLGCCGLVEAGRTVYVSQSRNPAAKTAYTAQLAVDADSEGEYYVGVHPMVSQAAAHKLLPLIHPDAVWESEVRIDEHTRLDYVGTLPGDGKKIYVEVKTAMISMQCGKPRQSRRAVFPEGYKKKKGDPVSPRAIKHAELLGQLAAKPDTHSCVLLYIVPRTDCGDGMEVSTTDMWYNAAVRAAVRAGVQVRAFCISYTPDCVTFGAEAPVYLDLEC